MRFRVTRREGLATEYDAGCCGAGELGFGSGERHPGEKHGARSHEARKGGGRDPGVGAQGGLHDGDAHATGGAGGLKGGDRSVDGTVRTLCQREEKNRQDTENCQQGQFTGEAARNH